MNTPTITRIETQDPSVYAFEIRGGTRPQDVDEMARMMKAGFERPGRVSMLLIMSDVGISDALAGVSFESLEAQGRSPGNVEKYAVVGAPTVAEVMIRTMRRFIPVEARVFATEDEAGAWSFVGTRPTAS